MSISIIEVFQSGGPFMYLILMVLCLAIAIILERFYFLYYRYNISGPKLFQQLRQTVLKGEVNRAIGFCDDSPLPAILKAGLQQFQGKKEMVMPAMEEVACEVIPKIQKRTPYLAVLANIATLLGLLGTILGLIMSFTALGGADAGEKAMQLAKGISVAMSTTAFGLIVAIPCLLFSAILQSKTNKLIEEIDEFSLKTANFLQTASVPEEGQPG